jgi:hypothetical protein
VGYCGPDCNGYPPAFLGILVAVYKFYITQNNYWNGLKAGDNSGKQEMSTQRKKITNVPILFSIHLYNLVLL